MLNPLGETPLARIDQDAIERGARKVYPERLGRHPQSPIFTPASAVLPVVRPNAAPASGDLSSSARRSRTPPFRWLTPEEAERLIEAASPHLKAVHCLRSSITGARSGEALGARSAQRPTSPCRELR